jgi:exonuclease SbcD
VDIGRPVVTLSDTLENLIKSPKYDVHKQSFVRARLTDKNLQLGVMEKLRARFPHVLITEQTSLTEQGALSRDQADRARQSPIDIVDSYVDESFEDIDEFQREFVAKAVAGAVNGDTK